MDARPLDLTPRRVVALGVTWRSHARETGEVVSAKGPAVFSRDPASLATGGRVVIPSHARIHRCLETIEPGLGDELRRRDPEFPALFDYEIELGFGVLEDGALGWFLANDLTVRTVQILGEGTDDRMRFWSAAKSFPSTLLVGTTLLPSNEIPNLELVLRVNGMTRQRARSNELMYSAADLRRFAGPLGPLAQGDVVLTGTPAGVALSVARWKRALADVLFDRWRKLGAASRSAKKDARFLRAGDTIEMEAGPLGALRAVVEEEPA